MNAVDVARMLVREAGDADSELVARAYLWAEAERERLAGLLERIAALPCSLDVGVRDERLYIDGDCASCFAGVALPSPGPQENERG